MSIWYALMCMVLCVLAMYIFYHLNLSAGGKTLKQMSYLALCSTVLAFWILMVTVVFKPILLSIYGGLIS